MSTLDGYRLVGIAPSSAGAWQVLQSRPVDVLLLGESTGVKNATGLLRRLRYANLPLDVIVVSSSSDASAIRELQRLGVSDYLISPVMPERLLQSLRQIGNYARTASLVSRQSEADELRALSMPARPWVPRELSAQRLADVRRLLASAGLPASAADVAHDLGISRVTARRYLEFLVSTGELDSFNVAERPGRPSKLYETRMLLAN